MATQVIVSRGESTTITRLVGPRIKLIPNDVPLSLQISAYLKSHERHLFMQMITISTETQGGVLSPKWNIYTIPFSPKAQGLLQKKGQKGCKSENSR